MPVGDEEGEGKESRNGAGCSPRRAHVLGPSISLLQVGILREFSVECFSRISISFPGVVFQGHGLY